MFKNNYPQAYIGLYTKIDRFIKILSLTENKIRKKGGPKPNLVVLYRIIPYMENYLTVEQIPKANWTTLSPALKDKFLYLWKGFGVAPSIRSGASSSWAGQQELEQRRAQRLPSAFSCIV